VTALVVVTNPAEVQDTFILQRDQRTEIDPSLMNRVDVK
jgi:hypothetical protein